MSERPRKEGLGAEAIGLLLEVMDGPRAELSAAAAQLAVGGARLLASDLLVRIGDASVTATEDDHSDALVSLVPIGEEAAHDYFSSTGGLVPVAREVLGIFRADVPLILNRMTRGLGLPRFMRPAVLIEDLVWEIGPVRLPKRRQRPMVWFARRVWDQRTRAAIEEATRRRPQDETRILLTSASAHRIARISITGLVVISIEDSLITRDELLISPEALAARIGASARVQAADPVRTERYVLSTDQHRLTIDGSVEFDFRSGEPWDAITKLHAEYLRGRRLPIGELSTNGSMRRLFGPRWPRLKHYINVIDGRWGFAE